MDNALTSLSPPSDMTGALVVYKLLSQTSSLPCSSGAAAFVSLVPSENDWFPLALNALLPILQDQNIQPSQRILAAYVLYALYASHDHLDPFRDHLLRIFESERAAVVAHSRTMQLAGLSNVLSSPQGTASVQAENDQLVWVLWKILKGEGDDLSPYSPDILSRTALPEHLRAPHLVLQNVQHRTQHSNDVNGLYPSISRNTRFAHQLTNLSDQTHMPQFEQEISSSASLSPTDSFAQYIPPASSRPQSTSAFSPFEPDLYADLNVLQAERSSTGNESNGWRRDASANFIHQGQQPAQSELPRRLDPRSTRSQLDIPQFTSPSPIATSKNHRQEALLHALCVEPQPESTIKMSDRTKELIHLRSSTTAGSNKSQDIFDPAHRMGWSGADLMSGQESAQQPLPRHSPISPLPVSSHAQSQFLTSQNNELNPLGRHLGVSTSSLAAGATPSDGAVARPQLGPIARPRPAPSLFYNSDSQGAAPPTMSTNLTSLQYASAEVYSQTTRYSPINGLLQQTEGSTRSGFTQNIQTPPTKMLLQPMRSPGVIGSGRPSSKPISPVSSDASERERHPNAGVIGNGRPARRSPAVRGDDVNEGSAGIVQCSVERTEQRREQERYFGAVERPKNSGRNVGEWLAGGMVGDMEVVRMREYPNHTSPEVREAPTMHPPTRSAVWDSRSNGDPRESVLSPISSEISQHQAPQEFRAGNIPSPISSSPEKASSPETPYFTSYPSQEISPVPTSASTSPTAERKQPDPRSDSSHSPPGYVTSTDVMPRPEIDEKARDELSRAIILLLSARERVLTLSEQRFLIPHLSMLTRPLSLLRPGDLHPLISNNPDVAAKLLVLVLDRDDEDGAKVERVLRDVNRNDLFPLQSAHESSNQATSTSIGAVDVVKAAVQFVTGVSGLSSDAIGQGKVSPFGGREAKEGYLDALRRLPPSMQSFNLIAKLLRPANPFPAAESSGHQETPEVRVARLVRTEVLGGLVGGCVCWIEKAEEGERNGEVLDDRVAVSVSSLSRFYSSLLKHDFVSAESEVDTTEIMSFALRFSRFEEARSLYSTLAAARA